MTQHAPTIDLLVLGPGMAGHTAASKAAKEGASVVLVDKAPAVGGSAAYAGFIWTAPSIEVMREVNPDGDPALGSRWSRTIRPCSSGCARSASRSGSRSTSSASASGGRPTSPTLLMTYERIVRDTASSELILDARTERLLLEDRAVCGAELILSSGERREIRARATLLATGGFGGDPDLRARHIHAQARDMKLRANTYSTGDGLRLGLSAGAAFGPENAGFYGQLIASPVPYDNPYEFTDLTFYHSEHGVLLNLDGRRFCDETIGDHVSPLALIEQPEARALLIYDQRVHDDWMMQPYVKGIEPIDKFQLAYRRGARCAVAEELEEFGELPDEWGFPGPAVLESLIEFNRQCEAGRPKPGRKRDATPLTHPPYYVIEVVPAITMTFAGLLIDPEARVLDEHGNPIPGLLAAGGDSGGVYVSGGYAGGLANALTFGLRAARTALDRAAQTITMPAVTASGAYAD
jgi:succinate dehydrogenase/fumarate reductase flavoprotein subunit